jgi:formamidopyrimidine-DNA glycosylase
MPELPEVETIARGLHARVKGERIERAWFGSKPESFLTPAADMAALLPGRRIDRVSRVGKHIVFDLSEAEAKHTSEATALSLQWIVHLGMTGRLLVAESGLKMPAHAHAVLGLSSGRELRFVDARRFGRLALRKPEQGWFRGPGAEPLGISQDAFRALFAGRRTPIKSALLNQKLLHGVGNIYADESLFRAGIRPRRMAGRLSRAELDRLRQALGSVLEEAIHLGGSSVSDYVNADGARGFFQLEHRVYRRTGEPCLVCGTPVRRILLGGRGTHFCPRCQS